MRTALLTAGTDLVFTQRMWADYKAGYKLMPTTTALSDMTVIISISIMSTVSISEY